MTRLNCILNTLAAGAALLLTEQCSAAPEAASTVIRVDSQSPGRLFEGLGALSAGASSRLLMDYPEPQRSRILDFLFKPEFGASLQHLKVELGGDVNSTDGTEPSHARTRDEFENPKSEYFERGYEWWLMREAHRRNPEIRLDVLQWGAPGWIGGVGEDRARFYSQDNADFIASFLRGAKKHHSLAIDYCGIWNETAHDPAWIKRLRQTLDRAGLKRVEIVAADEVRGNPWGIAGEMLADPELMNAVQVVGAHYPHSKSTAEALQTGKPLWASEDGPWRGDWAGACKLARAFNRNYIEGKMTKTIIWSLITSYYDLLPLPNSGPMMAKEPWSGHYEVQPALWAIAHTTQFAHPGWRYIDSGCGPLAGGGSCVALRGPLRAGDFSVVIETIDAPAPQTLRMVVGEGLSKKALHVWRSTALSQFKRLADVPRVGGGFTVTLEPGVIYSFTTTSGQQKGEAVSPLPAEFPCPYFEDFETSPVGKYARYFSDQGGVFEVAKRPEGEGRCLRQTIPRRGIDWHFHPTPEPYTLIGSAHWRNYEVAVDACIEDSGYVSLGGRVMASLQNAQPAKGYRMELTADGKWRLCGFTNLLAQGRASIRAGEWHNLKLRFSGSRISGLIDGVEVAAVFDSACRRGMAALGTGWNCAMFDNFSVRPIEGPDSPNLALGKPATASSQWDDQHPAAAANDGQLDTRWNAAQGKAIGEWLELDFGQPTRFNNVHLVQFGQRITRYRLESQNGDQWAEVISGNSAGRDDWAVSFPEVEARKIRLVVLEVSGPPEQTSPSIYEFEVYRE